MNDKSISRIQINGDVYKLKSESNECTSGIELTNENCECVDGSTVINLHPGVQMYSIKPSASTNISINAENLSNPAKFVLAVDFTDDIYPLSFNSDTSFRWKDGKLPDMSLKGIHTIDVTYMKIGNRDIFSGNYNSFLKAIINYDTTGVITTIDEQINENYSGDSFQNYSLESSPSNKIGDFVDIRVNETGYINNFTINSYDDISDIVIISDGTINNVELMGDCLLSFDMNKGEIGVFENYIENGNINIYGGNIDYLYSIGSSITCRDENDNISISRLSVINGYLECYGHCTITDLNLDMTNAYLYDVNNVGTVDILLDSSLTLEGSKVEVIGIHDGGNLTIYDSNITDQIFIQDISNDCSVEIYNGNINSIYTYGEARISIDGGQINKIESEFSADLLPITNINNQCKITEFKCINCFRELFINNFSVLERFDMSLNDEAQEVIPDCFSVSERTIHLQANSTIGITKNVQTLIANNIIFIDADETSQIINLEN